jgi:hypothetical protein
VRKNKSRPDNLTHNSKQNKNKNKTGNSYSSRLYMLVLENISFENQKNEGIA